MERIGKVIWNTMVGILARLESTLTDLHFTLVTMESTLDPLKSFGEDSAVAV